MSEIKQEQKAKLTFKTADNSEKEFDCFIKDVQKDRLSLRFPEEILAYADYLEEGNELPVKIFTPSGVKAFDAVILNSPLESEFVIEFVENHIEIQRREYLRVELETKLIIERIENTNIITRTLDIGGGGLKFFYEGSFKPDEIVGCLLYLPYQIHSVKAQGIIKESPYLNKNEHILLFSKIDENERARIVKQCFDIQTGQHREIGKSEML